MGIWPVLLVVVLIVLFAMNMWGPRRRRLAFALIGRLPATLLAVASPGALRRSSEEGLEQRLHYLADPWQATPWRFRWLQGTGLILGVLLACTLALWMSEGHARVKIDLPGVISTPPPSGNAAQPNGGPPGLPGSVGAPAAGDQPAEPELPPEQQTAPPGFGIVVAMFLSAGLALLGWSLPRQALNRKVEQRKQRLLLQLADLLELMAITMQAGAEFDQALETATATIYDRYSRKPDQYPLGVELAQAVFERNMGVSRADFMGALGLRATMRTERNEDELSDAAVTLWDELTQAVTLSQEVGSSLKETLPEIVERVRNGRLKSAEQAAANARVSMIYPQMMLVLALMGMLLASVGLFIADLLSGGL
jgi:hypothetical protein